MSDIDPEKLEQDIKIVEEGPGGWGPDDFRAAMRRVADAARAHLATLPRYKEVEVVQWVSVDRAGEVHGCWDHESQARISVGRNDSLSVVRLTGTAKVKVTP